MKEEQLSRSKVCIKAFVGEDAILLRFKPSKISLCIHGVQACCNLARHTVSFTTASVLPTLWHVLTDHATQNANGLLLLMHLEVISVINSLHYISEGKLDIAG